jgi:hypothetical protein
MAGAPKRRKSSAGNVSDELQRLLHHGGINLNGLHSLLRKVDTFRSAGGPLPGRASILAANNDRFLL